MSNGTIFPEWDPTTIWNEPTVFDPRSVPRRPPAPSAPGFDWSEVAGSVIKTGAQAGFQILNQRYGAQAQRDVAKARSGAAGWTPVQRRIQQTGQMGAGSKSIKKMMRRMAKGKDPMPFVGGGGYVPAPYVTQAEYDPSGLPEPFESAMELYQAGRQFLFPTQQRTGGVPVADSWGEMFTPSGNLRGTVAIMQPNGGMTFARNVGQPVLFSRDATICKRVRSRSAKVAHAAGHRHTVTRRKR